jgi:hypothetical protein
MRNPLVQVHLPGGSQLAWAGQAPPPGQLTVMFAEPQVTRLAGE